VSFHMGKHVFQTDSQQPIPATHHTGRGWDATSPMCVIPTSPYNTDIDIGLKKHTILVRRQRNFRKNNNPTARVIITASLFFLIAVGGRPKIYMDIFMIPDATGQNVCTPGPPYVKS
jgi:hypothetical protein